MSVVPSGECASEWCTPGGHVNSWHEYDMVNVHSEHHWTRPTLKISASIFLLSSYLTGKVACWYWMNKKIRHMSRIFCRSTLLRHFVFFSTYMLRCCVAHSKGEVWLTDWSQQHRQVTPAPCLCLRSAIYVIVSKHKYALVFMWNNGQLLTCRYFKPFCYSGKIEWF